MEPEYDPDVWGPDKVTQLLPRRRFFPGQTYEPHELSPKTKVDWSKIRNTFTPKSCPLGGRKGPKVDWTNVTLLQRFLTDGGNIKPRRVTKVGSPPVDALATANAVEACRVQRPGQAS